MKQSPLVSQLSLFDLANTPGVAADLSHINSRAVAKGYQGNEQLAEALKGDKLNWRQKNSSNRFFFFFKNILNRM